MTEPASQRRAAWRWALPALLAFAAVLALGWRVLSVAHPHEDAFILFKYARNLAAGEGIVYWSGGPPAEGATDFLWMCLLAALAWLGCDVALAACLANAAGAGLLVLAASRLSAAGGARAVLAWVPLAFLATGPAFAAYLGFSALLYCALTVLLFQRTVSALEAPHAARAIPWLALALALFRPDGAILGAVFAALGALAAWRAGALSSHGRHLLGAALAGALYFVWRWSYFGLPLPLPLYVKGHDAAGLTWSGLFADPFSALPGLQANLAWLTGLEGPLPLLAACALLLFLLRSAGTLRSARWIGLALLPALALLLSLCFARQTQNIGARFQAPALALCLFALIALAARAWPGALRRRLAILGIVAAALAPGLVSSAPKLPRLFRPGGYADTFSVLLGRILPAERVLALTEAGRLAYWSRARVEDLIGLNTERTALAPVDRAYLESLEPDIVMFYAGAFSLRDTLRGEGAVLEVRAADLNAAVLPAYAQAYASGASAFTRELTPEKVAAAVAARYLADSERHQIFAVRELGSFRHVYGIRTDLPERAAILDALRATTGPDARYLPYWAAIRRP